MVVRRVKREGQTEYPGCSGLTQNEPFVLLARLSHFRKWIKEWDEEEKEKERGRRKDYEILAEMRAEAQGM